ncbi:MAG: MCP four helix bundle domain-containing protein, partial [Anaerolineae bacterium]|nr:MCP four helix bundle domain-containing protein [Anaerolineae bacterium]
MSLRIKLASLFIFVALSILVIGLVNIQLMRGTTQEYTKLTDQNVPVFEALGHIHSSVTKIREETLTVLLLISEAQQSQTTPHQLDQEILEEYEEVEEAYQDFTLWLDHYSALVTDPRRQALVQEIAQVGRDGFEASQMIITLKEQEGSGDTIFGHRDNLEQAEKDIDALLNTAIDLERAAFNANRSQANSNANLTYAINTISILASLGLAIFTGWIISRTVADPITKLK